MENPSPREPDAVDDEPASNDIPDAESVPDPKDARRAGDLVPDTPPEDAPTIGDPSKKTAVQAPVPSHGAVASSDQLREGERAEALLEAEEPAEEEAR